MGFWSTLGKIGKGALGLAAAPATGGASLIPMIADVAGSVGSSLASGAQKGRETQNVAAQDKAGFQLAERKAAEDALMGRQDLDLKQRGFKRDAQTDAYRKALQGALGKNVQDVSLSMPAGIPKFSFGGGLRPSALGQEGRDAATELNRQAMQALMAGESFDTLPGIERTAAPEYKKPGFWENTLGAIGTAGTAIGGANAAAEGRSQQERIAKAIEELSKGPAQLPGTQFPPPLPPGLG